MGGLFPQTGERGVLEVAGVFVQIVGLVLERLPNDSEVVRAVLPALNDLGDFT